MCTAAAGATKPFTVAANNQLAFKPTTTSLPKTGNVTVYEISGRRLDADPGLRDGKDRGPSS